MSKDYNAYDELQELKKEILERTKEKLEDLKGDKEVKRGKYDFNTNDIHEIIHDCVDGFISNCDRGEYIDLIDECNNEDVIDKGLIDDSDLDRILLTMAFACVEQWLFDNSDLLMDLQEYELNEKKRKDFVERIKEELAEN